MTHRRIEGLGKHLALLLAASTGEPILKVQGNTRDGIPVEETIVNIPITLDPRKCMERESFDANMAERLTVALHETIRRFSDENPLELTGAILEYAFATILNIHQQTNANPTPGEPCPNCGGVH